MPEPKITISLRVSPDDYAKWKEVADRHRWKLSALIIWATELFVINEDDKEEERERAEEDRLAKEGN